ncbi:hypothetical protein, partial [Streptomyces sp. SID10692]|uniref:hypothetical protein n=1 Tax=Streptomyces sp. SID10692 TaxID=2706026 RepID=UPI0019446DFB
CIKILVNGKTSCGIVYVDSVNFCTKSLFLFNVNYYAGLQSIDARVRQHASAHGALPCKTTLNQPFGML